MIQPFYTFQKPIIRLDYTVLDRWGAMVGNINNVELRVNESDKATFSLSLIETTLEKGKLTYTIFPKSGSEMDIFVYKLTKYSPNCFDTEDSILKKKIFMWGTWPEEKAIRIDDLPPGYYVDYMSCNYEGGYILWIR